MSQSNRPAQLRQSVDFNSVLLVNYDQPEEGEQNSSQSNDQMSDYNKVLDCFNKITERNTYSSSNVSSIIVKNRQNSGSKQHENLRKSKQNAQQIHLGPPVLLNSAQNLASSAQQQSALSTTNASSSTFVQNGLLNLYQNQINHKGNSSHPSLTARGSVLQAKGKKLNQIQQNKNILNGINVINQQQIEPNQGVVQPILQQQPTTTQQQHQQQIQQQLQQQQSTSQQQFINDNNYIQQTVDQQKIRALILQQSQQQSQFEQQNPQMNQNNSVFFQNKRLQNSDSTFDSTCSSTVVQESSYITPRNTNNSLQNSFIIQGPLHTSQILNFNDMGGSSTSSHSQSQHSQFSNKQSINKNRNSISTHQVYQNNNNSTNINNTNNNNNSGMCFGYNSKIVRQMSQLSIGDYSQQQQSQNTTITTPRGNNNYPMIPLHYPQHYQQGQNHGNYHHRHLSYSNNSSSQQHSFLLSQHQHSHMHQHSYSSNSNNQSFQGSQAYHTQAEFMFSPMIHNQSNDSISQNNCHLSSMNSLNTSFQQNYNSQCQIDDQNKSRTFKSESFHIMQQQQQLNDSSQKIISSVQQVQSGNQQSQQAQQSHFYQPQTGNQQQNGILPHLHFTPLLQQQLQQNQTQQNSQKGSQQVSQPILQQAYQKYQTKPSGLNKKNTQVISKGNNQQQNIQQSANNQSSDMINPFLSSQLFVAINMNQSGNGNNNLKVQDKTSKEITSQIIQNQLSRKVRSITNNMIEQNQILEEEDDRFEKEAESDSDDDDTGDKKLKSDDQNKVNKKADKKSSKGTRKRKVIAQEEESNYLINPENVKSDCRTTVMIKNIPNKYSLQALMEKIDENHTKTYDFFYLPIDFRNKCNVGYAFINFIDPEFIKPFYEEFHNQKWAKFNSEKVCLLYYARLQGRSALIHHFQHSSVMNQKDKKLKPVILPKNEVNTLEQLLKNQRDGFQNVSLNSNSRDSRNNSPSDAQENERVNMNSQKEPKEKSQSKESIKSRASNNSSSNTNIKEEKINSHQMNETHIQSRSSSIKSSSLLSQNYQISSISKSISPTNHQDIQQRQVQQSSNKQNILKQI